jgi:hypothetical protein
VIGVVSWSTGPQLSAGCGGLTGVTPLTRYRTWIVDTAAKMGAVMAPPSLPPPLAGGGRERLSALCREGRTPGRDKSGLDCGSGYGSRRK